MRRDFQWRRKVETCPGARVQVMRDGVQLALRVARQVRALGPVLAQQPVRVVIGPALPRTVRIGKEDLEREPLGQLRVFGHLFPSVVGQGLPQQGGHMPEFLGEALSGTRPHSGERGYKVARTVRHCSKRESQPCDRCSDSHTSEPRFAHLHTWDRARNNCPIVAFRSAKDAWLSRSERRH